MFKGGQVADEFLRVEDIPPGVLRTRMLSDKLLVPIRREAQQCDVPP